MLKETPGVSIKHYTRVIRLSLDSSMLLPLPAGLPSPNPTRGYWQEPASPLAEHRTTSTLPKAVDYAIVGSGITGASIAHGILQNEPDASVVLLEAREVCSGASGRNGKEFYLTPAFGYLCTLR